eukprot:4017046-Prymnesium_polylepis.1
MVRLPVQVYEKKVVLVLDRLLEDLVKHLRRHLACEFLSNLVQHLLVLVGKQDHRGHVAAYRAGDPTRLRLVALYEEEEG